jgi:hypothetical protein
MTIETNQNVITENLRMGLSNLQIMNPEISEVFAQGYARFGISSSLSDSSPEIRLGYLFHNLRMFLWGNLSTKNDEVWKKIEAAAPVNFRSKFLNDGFFLQVTFTEGRQKYPENAGEKMVIFLTSLGTTLAGAYQDGLPATTIVEVLDHIPAFQLVIGTPSDAAQR